MEQDRATPDFCHPVFLWDSSRNRHVPAPVPCSCWIYLYRRAGACFFLPLLAWCFWCVFCRAELRRLGFSLSWPTKCLVLWSSSLSATKPCTNPPQPLTLSRFFCILSFLSFPFGLFHSTMRGFLEEFHSSLSFITRKLGISPDPPRGQWSTCHPILSFLLAP